MTVEPVGDVGKIISPVVSGEIPCVIMNESDETVGLQLPYNR